MSDSECDWDDLELPPVPPSLPPPPPPSSPNVVPPPPSPSTPGAAEPSLRSLHKSVDDLTATITAHLREVERRVAVFAEEQEKLDASWAKLVQSVGEERVDVGAAVAQVPDALRDLHARLRPHGGHAAVDERLARLEHEVRESKKRFVRDFDLYCTPLALTDVFADSANRVVV